MSVKKSISERQKTRYLFPQIILTLHFSLWSTTLGQKEILASGEKKDYSRSRLMVVYWTSENRKTRRAHTQAWFSKLWFTCYYTQKLGLGTFQIWDSPSRTDTCRVHIFVNNHKSEQYSGLGDKSSRHKNIEPSYETTYRYGFSWDFIDIDNTSNLGLIFLLLKFR